MSVVVVGLGVLNLDHLTREADQALRTAQEILYLDGGLATHAYLSTCCDRVTPLAPMLEEGTSDAHQHIAAKVIDAALDHGPVVLALTGHPTVGAPVTALLQELCAPLELPIRLVAGISSLGAVAATLGFDPLARGLQCFDATDVVLHRRVLSPEVPLWLFGLGALETSLHSTKPSQPGRFQRLRDLLLHHYTPTHPVLAVHASPHPLAGPQLQRFALADLCA